MSKLENNPDGLNQALFDFKGKLSLGAAAPMGMQHLAAAVVGVVTPALIISSVCGLNSLDTTILVQVSLIISALATLLQICGIGPIGARLPVIAAVSFAYVPTMQSIGSQFGLSAILGTQLIGGIVAILVGIYIKRIRFLFPPVVIGTVIFTIGLSLYPTAIKYMAGGVGSPEFGSMKNWGVALLTFAIVIFFNNFTEGIWKLSSILIGMCVGYVVALAIGMVSFEAVGQAGWFQVIIPLHFGLSFPPAAVVTMIIMFIVNAVQAIGDFTSTTVGGMDRQPTDEEISSGIIGNGLVSMISAIFGGMPVATFSQNVGIVTVNKVVNRMVFIFTAVVFLVAGFVPKFSSILTTIPQSVIGGATISVFAMITMTGIRIIASAQLTSRNVSIVGLAAALGVGVSSVPNVLAGFPDWVSTIFASSSIVLATLVAIILNLILPKD
ncbi:MAG: uracil-xanthine permease family protein [Lachnospirales bacterium]